MNVRQPFSRRRFVGGVAAAVGAMGLRPDAELFAQGQTQQFTGGDAEYDAYVKLASNENNWGPPDSVMKAMNNAWKYANRYGYPDGNVNQVIAEHHGVRRDNILLTAGSGEGLNVMATTYLKPGLKVIGVSPSYASVFQQAANVKADSIQLPLTKDYRQDIGQLVEVTNRYAREIGFVYLCNPNNPTGAVVTAKEVKQLLDGIPKDMPVLIDEAYHHYVDDPAYGTAIPYVTEGRPVVVARTFSKAHGMAGMRTGYVLGMPETIKKLNDWEGASYLNVPGLIAAAVSIKDQARLDAEKALNPEARQFTVDWFKARGCEPTDSQCNFIFVNVNQPVRSFREACRKEGVLVARDFPPYEKSHCRISIGTLEEMKQATEVFGRALAAAPAKAA